MNLTKRQIQNIVTENEISAEVRGAGKNWEIELTDDAQHERFCKAVETVADNFGGFRTGYGAWILRPGYESKGDWNDSSSRWHY
jgi:hypothetical protein